jgi:THO complex subunit 5
MIPVDEFIAQYPEHATSDEHELTMARIEDEQRARQELNLQRQMLVKRKDALLKETGAKKDELNKLDEGIEKWLGGQEAPRKIFEAREKKLADAEVKRRAVEEKAPVGEVMES